ncbi:uncharacterized protein [Anoplolepis gracilipes]|uniref:uncharacterized protein isoform X6 n=1 Tax=Anoplolepis gracilipes TaxID=354296 RepID=UPI003B9FB1F6
MCDSFIQLTSWDLIIPSIIKITTHYTPPLRIVSEKYVIICQMFRMNHIKSVPDSTIFSSLAGEIAAMKRGKTGKTIIRRELQIFLT